MFRDFQTPGKEFLSVQYADDLVLLVKEISVLLGIVCTNTKTEIERCFETEMSMGKILGEMCLTADIHTGDTINKAIGESAILKQILSSMMQDVQTISDQNFYVKSCIK
jgi:hypothetical protein